MKNFINQFLRTRYEIMVDEKHIVDVLRVLDRHNVTSDLNIMNCECGLGDKWYIAFDATGREMSFIKTELKGEKFKEIVFIQKADRTVERKES